MMTKKPRVIVLGPERPDVATQDLINRVRKLFNAPEAEVEVEYRPPKPKKEANGESK
jgi:hypothetical protein